MFLLSKILTDFILPPGIFVVLLVACLILLLIKKNTIARIVLIASIAILYTFSIEPVSDGLIFPLENRYPPLSEMPTKDTVDYIVVLGGGIIPKSPEENNLGSLHSDALKRTHYAARVHRESGIPVIVAGGKPLFSSEAESESAVAARVLAQSGVAPQMVQQESESRNTWENAANLKNLYDADSIILVTSAYHMLRSVQSFRDNGIECIPAPTDYKVARVPYDLLSFLPNPFYLSNSYRALKEYVGIVYYYFRYRLL